MFTLRITTHQPLPDEEITPFLELDFKDEEESVYEYYYDLDPYADPETLQEVTPTREEWDAVCREFQENCQYLFGWLDGWQEANPGVEWQYNSEDTDGYFPESEAYQAGKAYFNEQIETP